MTHDQDHIVTFICDKIKKALPDAPALSAQTDMTTDISIDSLATMDLVFALEEEFDISVPLNALAEIRTIGELAALVEKTKS